jgi:hypothetical protein
MYMEIIRNSYGILIILIVCATVFYLANSRNFFGKVIDSIFPCTQNPESSFPCYGTYDIIIMVIASVVGIICISILLYRVYRTFIF